MHPHLSDEIPPIASAGVVEPLPDDRYPPGHTYQMLQVASTSAGLSAEITAAEFPFAAQELLDRCIGNVDFAKSILLRYQDDSEKLLQKILRYTVDGDVLAVSEAAHGLKGIAGIVTARHVQHMAALLESAGKAGRLDQVRHLVDALDLDIRICRFYLPSVQQQIESRQVSAEQRGQ